MRKAPGAGDPARQYLAQLQLQVQPELRRVRWWALGQGLVLVGQLSLLAWLVATSITAEALHSGWPGWLTLLLVLLLLRAGCSWAQDRAAATLGEQVQRQARSRLLASWRAQPGAAHQPARASLLVEPVQALGAYYSRFLPQLWVATLVPVTILVVVYWLDWVAGTFLLLAAPLIPLFMALVGMGAEHLNQKHLMSLQRLSGLFVDRLRHLTTLQLFSRTQAAWREAEHAANDYRQLNMKTLKVAFLSSAVLEFFSAVAIAAVAIYIGFSLLGYFDFGPATELTLVSGLVILVLAPEFFQPLRTLSQFYHDRAAALGAAAELMAQEPAALTDREPAAVAKAPTSTPSSSASLPSGDELHSPGGATAHTSAVSVSGVSFGFTPGRPLFYAVNLQVPAGQQLAVTGPSGSGKSSFLHLLAGFHRPDTGTITVAGAPPGERAIGYLQQTPFLGQGSLADNLRLVAPQASDTALQAALGQAGLGAVVERLPAGMQTPLGEQGVGLSGGEARRLALARVYLTQVPVVLLDEPTAGLDAATATDVRQAIAGLRSTGTTVIIATHDQVLAEQCEQQLQLQLSGGKHAIGG